VGRGLLLKGITLVEKKSLGKSQFVPRQEGKNILVMREIVFELQSFLALFQKSKKFNTIC